MAKEQNRTQTKQIVIRMTEDDFKIVEQKVQESGLKQAEYLRQAILNPRIINTEGMKELVPELKRVGNNLNQIARVVNTGGYQAGMDSEVERIGKELDHIWQLLRRYATGQV